MFFYYNAPALIWAVVIFVLCTIPGNELPDLGFWNIDKVGHAGIFGILSCLILYGLTKQKSFQWFKLKAFFISVFFCAFYGAFTEVVQGVFIYRRTAEFSDFIADSLGAFIFTWLFKRLGQKWLGNSEA